MSDMKEGAAAFYELADMMGIVARSPKDVWKQQMRPRLAAMLSRERLQHSLDEGRVERGET